MIGININCREYDFLSDILSGKKDIETRKTRSLNPYIGQRVGLIRTGLGRASLVGYATVTGCIEYENEIHFIGDYNRHRVNPGSQYATNRFGYILTDVEQCDPIPVYSRGIVARKI